MFPNRSHFANQQHDVVDNTISMASKTIRYQQNVSHISGDGIERKKLKENLVEKLAAKKQQIRELNVQIKLHQRLEQQEKVRPENCLASASSLQNSTAGLSVRGGDTGTGSAYVSPQKIAVAAAKIASPSPETKVLRVASPGNDHVGGTIEIHISHDDYWTGTTAYRPPSKHRTPPPPQSLAAGHNDFSSRKLTPPTLSKSSKLRTPNYDLPGRISPTGTPATPAATKQARPTATRTLTNPRAVDSAGSAAATRSNAGSPVAEPPALSRLMSLSLAGHPMKKDELREEIAVMRVGGEGGGGNGKKKLLPDYLHVRNVLQGQLNRSLTAREKSMVAEILEETQVGEQLDQFGGGSCSKLGPSCQNKNKERQYRQPITMMLGKLRLNLDIEKRAGSLFAKSSKGSQQESFKKEQNQHSVQPLVADREEDDIREAWDDTYGRTYYFNRRTRKSGWDIDDVK
jgi:hypothetical protein